MKPGLKRPHEWFSPAFIQSIWGFFCLAEPYKLASTVRHRKGKVAGVTDWGGQRAFGDEVAKLLSPCQSLCHTGGPWMPPATQRCLFSPLRARSGLWETFFYSLSSSLSPLFYLDFLQADPFQPIISSQTAPERREKGPGEGGNGLKRCGICYRPWHPWTAVTWCFGPFPSLRLFHMLFLPWLSCAGKCLYTFQ